MSWKARTHFIEGSHQMVSSSLLRQSKRVMELRGVAELLQANSTVPFHRRLNEVATKQEKVPYFEPCDDCQGKGFLPLGGFHKKNPLTMSKILGSKWTARQKVFGWRHFEVKDKRKTSSAIYALLTSTCARDVQFWINAKNLKDRDYWACGWLQREQLDELSSKEQQPCKSCENTGTRETQL